ncbi:MAG: biotin/lipoyl-binding protein, partial [Clostridia bacterium]|nr:biotin/lipoyl-binding protein [Deltaproteobacteria bacterium]
MPRLREGLHVDVADGLVVARRAPGAAGHTMREIEWQIAQLLNGKRTDADIIRDAALAGLPINGAMLRSFMRELNAYGLLIGYDKDAVVEADEEPADVAWFVGQATILAQRGQIDAARHYLQAALEAAPETTLARSMLIALADKEDTALPTRQPSLLPAPRSTENLEVVDAEALEVADHQSHIDAIAAEQEASEMHAATKHRRKRTKIVMASVTAMTAVCAIIPWTYDIRAQIEVLPNESREISAFRAGEVRSLLVTQGSEVTAGDILVKLDPRELENQRAELLAELQKQQAELDRLRNGSRLFELKRAREEVKLRRAKLAFVSREYARKREGRDIVAAGEVERA